MAAPGFIDAVMLLGDSITQESNAGSLHNRLSQYFTRRFDVLNRGFGGYNSEWGIPVLERAFAKKKDREAGYAQKVQLLTIWFGANDAVLPGRPQYVPLDKFQANIKHLAAMVRDPKSEWYSPDTRVVLISPPPIIEEERLKGQMARWKEFGSEGPAPLLDRDAENTHKYAEAVVAVGKETGIPTVDLWSAVVKHAGGNTPDKLRPYLYDGLHFTSLGYEVLFDELKDLLLKTWPELEPESWPMGVPHWSEVDPANPRQAILQAPPKRDEWCVVM